MSKISMIHHINIQITDRERTREWYEKVLGAQFLDRGPALNQRQLQLRIGTGEIHTSDTPEVIEVPRVHFAIEVEDWDGMLSHLESVDVHYSRTAGGAFASVGDDSSQGHREDTNEHYTYINDPDGNLIELVYHPLGLESSRGAKMGLLKDDDNVRWTQQSGFVEDAYKAQPVQSS
ncbi:MAG: VOC family protein [Chloroflexi bacterium]|nr:VOC family protein [Chloroflexota bacterium]